MYQFIITKNFLKNQSDYTKKLSQKDLEIFESLKQIFIQNIFDKKLSTHKIYERKNINVYSSSIGKKERIIFFSKAPNMIYLYKIMTDHDYNKLLANIDFALGDFFDNF